MESSPSKTEGSVVRVPPTEAGTLSSFHLIMKIRRDLARALQELPGAPSRLIVLLSSSAFVALLLVHRFPSFSVTTRTPWQEKEEEAEE